MLFIQAPARAETPFALSQKLIESGKLSEARRALESELWMRPNNIEARYNLAILLEDSGHQVDALHLYKKNLSISWHLPSLANLTSALKQSGKSAEAVEWLKKGTRKLRHEATPWYLLAMISEQNHQIVKAESQYKKALKADPLNGFAYLHYAQFQSNNNLADKGLKHARKATKLLPDCAPCWRKYGNILRTAEMNQKALDAYQQSLAINPDKKTRINLISTLRVLGDHQRADQMQRGLNNIKENNK